MIEFFRFLKRYEGDNQISYQTNPRKKTQVARPKAVEKRSESQKPQDSRRLLIS